MKPSIKRSAGINRPVLTDMRLNGLDRHFLVTLDALMLGRNIAGRDAQHLSQPGMSAAAARLRAYSQEELWLTNRTAQIRRKSWSVCAATQFGEDFFRLQRNPVRRLFSSIKCSAHTPDPIESAPKRNAAHIFRQILAIEPKGTITAAIPSLENA